MTTATASILRQLHTPITVSRDAALLRTRRHHGSPVVMGG